MTITTRTHTKDIATTAIATTKAPEHTVKNILSLSRMMQFVAMGLSTQEKLGTGTLDEVLTVHQYGVAMTILNASMRIMRISHIDMQRVLYSLTRDFDAMCRTAMRTPLEQMSNYAPMTDILAASHVKAHVRLFMG